MILKKMGMSKKSPMKVTFNIYHEIEEIEDPMSHHTKELKISWGYANSVNLREMPNEIG